MFYGVCDGVTHSSAFFYQYGSTNWMTENPFNNNNPIFWLSDPPHMIKKLRNFLISQKRNLKYSNYDISFDHLADVAERGQTKLSSRHLFGHFSRIHLSSFHTKMTPVRTHFDHTTSAMDTLLESIVLRGQRSFHRSKMVLWTYLQQHTSNGRTTFPLSQMVGISNVFTARCSNMSPPEKNALFITDSVNIKCRKCNHCRNIVNTHSSYFIHHTNINIMDITDSTYDPVQVAEKVLVQQDILCSQRGICLRSNDDGSVCGGQLSHSSSVVNNPFLLVFELDKDENRPIQPGLSSKLHLRVKKDKYDLAAIIYHHNFHFWCEVFVSEKRYREGWFLYNDMWNNGKAEYVGKHPQVKTASYMYMLVFERSQVNMTTSCSKDHSASLKNIMSVAFQSNITPNAKQVKQNYINIFKSCSIPVNASSSSQELRAKLLQNEQCILGSLTTSKSPTTQQSPNTTSSKRKIGMTDDIPSAKKPKLL